MIAALHHCKCHLLANNLKLSFPAAHNAHASSNAKHIPNITVEQDICKIFVTWLKEHQTSQK